MKEIELTQGKVAIVDDCDYEKLMERKWFASRQRNSVNGERYYVATNEWVPEKKRQKTIFMHRIILSPPYGMYVDHVNGNGLDNRRENIRICTHSQNQANTGPLPSNKTGYKGVRRIKNRNSTGCNFPYQAIIIATYLGTYRTKEEAALVYDAAAIKEYGEFAYLNFPDGPTAEILKIIEEAKLVPAIPHRNNKSGYLGVTKIVDKNKNKPDRVYYKARYSKTNLGWFKKPEEAAKAYDKKAYELLGDRALLNFPEEIYKAST